MQRYVTELIGTFFLVLTIALVLALDSPMGAIAIGSVLMVMIYMGGHISGAHYNPAVTLAIYLRGKLKPTEILPYWGAQLAGGLLAALVAAGLTGERLVVEPGRNVDPMTALVVEIIFTFALVLVILNVATTRATQGNSYFGVAIGFTVVAGALAGGPISGGAFNPAVGIGPALASLLRGGSAGPVWIYILGPVIGGVLAMLTFRFQHSGTEDFREAPIWPRAEGRVPPQTPAGPTERP